MTNSKLFTMSMFPLTQFGVFGNLAVKAINGGYTISFNNFNEPIIEDFSMATVFGLTAIMMAALFLIFLYLIPLKVSVDEENPLRWYYPFVCGCLRKRRRQLNFVEEANDIEVETPLLS